MVVEMAFHRALQLAARDGSGDAPATPGADRGTTRRSSKRKRSRSKSKSKRGSGSDSDTASELLRALASSRTARSSGPGHALVDGMQVRGRARAIRACRDARVCDRS